MPTNTVSTGGSSAKYFTFKREFEFDKTRNGKIYSVTEPAFVEWDKDTKQNLYVSSSCGGKLARVSLDSKDLKTKDGRDFTLKQLYLEFHSENFDGGKTREVFTFFWPDKFSKSLVAKLLSAEDYSNINILVGSFINKETGKIVPYINVYQGEGIEENKLKPSIYQQFKDKTYPEGSMIIPLKRWLKKVDKSLVTTEVYEEAANTKDGKYKMVDPVWEEEVDALYLSAVQILADKVSNQLSTQAQKPIEAEVVPTQEAPKDEKGLPDTDYIVAESTVKMPF